MQTALDCYPCFLRQALSAARRAQADPAVQQRVLLATMTRLGRSDGATTPIELAAAIDQVAAIVDNGSDAPGTLLEACSEDFRQRFAAADLILAKGQGNYESLSQVQAPVFFLLQAKCSVIADDLGVPVGSIVCRPPGAQSSIDPRAASGAAS